jgi:hypothetical protein
MTRYVMGCDLAGPEGFDAIVLMDAKTRRVVWQHSAPTGVIPRFPLWLRLQIWLRRVTVVREA